MKLIQLLYGVATYIPGVNELLAVGSGGTDTARYCYSVWLRHMVSAEKSGLDSNPRVIAELGPGDSLGIGMAALLSGSKKYFAFDLVQHANTQKNLEIFDELVELFRTQASIPGESEFPNVKPLLDDYQFPSGILHEDRLKESLSDSRIKRIRESIADYQSEESIIQYKAPWHDSQIVENNSVDMIFSQAVLEHVDDLGGAYSSMNAWLKPTGYISHQIDFRCHRTTNEWNGHWALSNSMWKLIRGNRPYSLNREPYTTHEKSMQRENFKVVHCDKTRSGSNLEVSQLAPEFQSISHEDLVTSAAFVQAIKA